MAFHATRYMTVGQLMTANSMLNHFFAERLTGTKTFFQTVQDNMRRQLLDDLPVLDRDGRLDFPEQWDSAQINQGVYKDVPSETTYRLIAKTDLGRTAVFNGAGTSLRTPLNEVLFKITTILAHNKPPRRSGDYQGSHFIFTNGRRGDIPSGQEKEGDFGEVVNLVDYASTLETPDYSAKLHRTYQRTMREILRSRLWLGEYDITLLFANPEAYGGNIYTSTYKKVPPPYQVPVILVAPLNTLPTRINRSFAFIKRRKLTGKSNLRNNMIARIRREALRR